MLLQSAEKEYANLGEYLRETRINLGLDLTTVAEETRIPPKSLQAIEESDFAALPAETFTRGFYTLYAKMLSLDPEDILQMYRRERPDRHKSRTRPTLPPTKLAEEMSNLAERPTFMPFSFFGLILLLSLVLGGFLCWYFSWNPATYLSQKLRSLDQSPQSIERALESRFDSELPEPSSEMAEWQQPTQNTQSNLFDLSSPVVGTVTGMHRAMFKELVPVFEKTDEEIIHTDLSEETNRLTLATDTVPERNRLMEIRSSSTRRATDKVVNIMSDSIEAKQSLDRIPLDLFQQNNSPTAYSLSENLL